jgi:NAD(P)H dehydrogenase (quinone)
MKKLLFILALVFVSVGVFSQANILVVYYSKTGHTRTLAEAVAQGALLEGKTVVKLMTVKQASSSDLLWADAIIVGSPVYNANIAAPVMEFISSWPFEGEPLKNKIGAAFATAGGISAGEELTQMNILQSMLIFGMIVVGGPDWKQPFGASAIVHEEPFQLPVQGEISTHFTEKGRRLGVRVAQVAIRMQGVGDGIME